MKDPQLESDDITLQNLRIFLEFSRTEHLGSAAEALDLSVGAVQRSLRSIETRLGVPIVRRDGRRLRLVHAGRILADQAALVLRTRDEAVDAVLVAAGRAHDIVRIGYLYSLGVKIMPTIVARLKTREPKARVELHHGSTEQLVGGVLAGRLDIAFVAPIPELPDLDTIPLFHEPLRLCVHADDPLAKRKTVDLREVRERGFVTLRQGFGTRTYLFEACARSGFRPTIAFEVDDIFSVEGIVGAGLAVSVLPERMQEHRRCDVAYVRLAPSCATVRIVGVAYRHAGKRQRALASLLECIQGWTP